MQLTPPTAVTTPRVKAPDGVRTGSHQGVPEAHEGPGKVRGADASSVEGHVSPKQLLEETMAGVVDFLGRDVAKLGLQEALEAARAWEDEDFGREAASRWAGGFTINPAKVNSDLARFKSAGRNIEHMARRRLADLSPRRMNREGIGRLSKDNPEIPKLLLLTEGLRINTPEGFRANGAMECPPLRRTYVETGGAVDKMISEIHDEGLAFFLPYEDAKLIHGLHFTEASWAKKTGKEKGRPIMDCSNSSVEGGWSLNSADVKEACRETFGMIDNPTPEDLVLMVLEFYEDEKAKDDSVMWEDLVLTKEDLKGAFTLLDIHPASVKHLAMLLSGGVVIIFLCGLFGWTGTPFAFNVITRALQWELNTALRGRVRIYCDDILGVTLRRYLEADKTATRAQVRSLLGPEAIAEDKYSAGRRNDWIGYEVDLDSERFTVARRNFRKALYRFGRYHIDGPHPVRHVEALASLADRYGCVFQAMRPFTADISACLWTKPQGGGKPPGGNRNRSFYLSAAAKRAVRFWRAMLCAGQVDEDHFTRPLSSFRNVAAAVTIEFDGSLKGGGILIFREDADSAMGGGRASFLKLGFGSDPAYQNASELITEILGVVTLRILGVQDVEVGMRGDSLVALAWFRAGRVPPTSHGHNAHMLMGAMAAAGAVRVVGTTHLPAKPPSPGAKSNDPCDRLSRGGSFKEIGYSGDTFLNLDDHPWAVEALDLCDPRRVLDDHDSFVAFWRRARQLAQSLTPEKSSVRECAHARTESAVHQGRAESIAPTQLPN